MGSEGIDSKMTMFCKDCKWYKRMNWLYGFGKFAKCTNPQSVIQPSSLNNYHLVDGSSPPSKEYHYCATMRNGDNRCGTAAKWFEAKE